jgi:hypothetical protein
MAFIQRKSSNKKQIKAKTKQRPIGCWSDSAQCATVLAADLDDAEEKAAALMDAA